MGVTGSWPGTVRQDGPGVNVYECRVARYAPTAARQLATDLLQLARLVVVEKVLTDADDAHARPLVAEELDQRLGGKSPGPELTG